MKTTITGEYIKEMLAKDMREDARKLLEYRDITIRIGTIPNAEGSAEANIGNTKVLAGVKLGVGEPMPDKPNEGNLMASAELLPLAAESFDVGPPTPEAIELARVTDRGIRAAGVVDLSKLFIEKDKVWNVFIDVYVLNYDGNLFDASALAAQAALSSCRMPKYDAAAETVIREGDLGRLPLANMVVSSTFGIMSDKIILDPNANEELFIDSRLTISTDGNNIRAMQKGLGGSGFTPKQVDTMMDVTLERSKDLRNIIKKSIGE